MLIVGSLIALAALVGIVVILVQMILVQLGWCLPVSRDRDARRTWALIVLWPLALAGTLVGMLF